VGVDKTDHFLPITEVNTLLSTDVLYKSFYLILSPVRPDTKQKRVIVAHVDTAAPIKGFENKIAAVGKNGVKAQLS
jgi:hypothetical protein